MLEQFLKAIHVPQTTIDALQLTPDANIDELTKAYLASRDAFYESTKLKAKLDEAQGATAKGMTLKTIKKINDILGMGLTNTQMEEYKTIEDFVDVAKKYKTDYDKTIADSSNAEILKQLDSFKLSASEKEKEIESLKTNYTKMEAAKEKEKNDAINLFKAKQYWNKLVLSDTDLPDIPGRDFTLESIEERIFSNYLVNADGTISNPDGSVATHPNGKEIAITNLAEVYAFYKEKAGLIKRNNAGEGEGTYVDGKFVPKSEGMGEHQREFLKQMSDYDKLK